MMGRLRSSPRAGLALMGLALLLLPFAVSAGAGNSWVRVLDFALLYIMLALGLNIVVGFAGLLDLGYIAFYGVGAYLYALLSSPHLAMAFPSLAPGLDWPLWVILPLGALLAGVIGDRPHFSPTTAVFKIWNCGSGTSWSCWQTGWARLIELLRLGPPCQAEAWRSE